MPPFLLIEPGRAETFYPLPAPSRKRIATESVGLQAVEKVITAWTGQPCPALDSITQPTLMTQVRVSAKLLLVRACMVPSCLNAKAQPAWSTAMLLVAGQKRAQGSKQLGAAACLH